MEPVKAPFNFWAGLFCIFVSLIEVVRYGMIYGILQVIFYPWVLRAEYSESGAWIRPALGQAPFGIAQAVAVCLPLAVAFLLERARPKTLLSFSTVFGLLGIGLTYYFVSNAVTLDNQNMISYSPFSRDLYISIIFAIFFLSLQQSTFTLTYLHLSGSNYPLWLFGIFWAIYFVFLVISPGLIAMILPQNTTILCWIFASTLILAFIFSFKIQFSRNLGSQEISEIEILNLPLRQKIFRRMKKIWQESKGLPFLLLILTIINSLSDNFWSSFTQDFRFVFQDWHMSASEYSIHPMESFYASLGFVVISFLLVRIVFKGVKLGAVRFLAGMGFFMQCGIYMWVILAPPTHFPNTQNFVLLASHSLSSVAIYTAYGLVFSISKNTQTIFTAAEVFFKARGSKEILLALLPTSTSLGNALGSLTYRLCTNSEIFGDSYKTDPLSWISRSMIFPLSFLSLALCTVLLVWGFVAQNRKSEMGGEAKVGVGGGVQNYGGTCYSMVVQEGEPLGDVLVEHREDGFGHISEDERDATFSDDGLQSQSNMASQNELNVHAGKTHGVL